MVNPFLVAYLCGWIVAIVGATFFLPCLAALYYGDESLWWFVFSGLIAMGAGGAMILAGLGQRDQEARFRDSLAVVGISWFLVSFLGALPYWFSGLLDFWGGIFESFSGFSSTGSTNILDLGAFPKGLLFWRSFTQYLGGMGIIVLMVAVLPFLGVGGQLMMKNELSGVTGDKLKPRVAQIAKILWMIYLSFTVALFLLYSLGGGEGVFDSLCLTFSTLSTGGFSNWNDSLGHYQGYYVPVVSLIFMFLGSVSFGLHYQLFTGAFRGFWANAEVLFFSAAIALGTLIVSLSLFAANYYRGVGETIFQSFFHVLSLIGTTGHARVNWETWPPLAVAVLFLLFFVGGCSGSTSGGLKCVRWIILLKSVHRAFRRYIHPRGVFPIRVNNKPIPDSILEGVWLFFILYFLLLGVSFLALSALGMSPLTAFSAAASSLGNVGPGLGPLGPASTYAWIPGPAKGVLSLLMLLGRLEFYSFLVIFIPEFWSK
ncbi:MAG: TrkH family potassium uptake protein [Deltaproteobacteria bacterium]|jgi:trk system potassium uptake protein TrkH|nr:TrkH family potassium uptake protein [Deltaproteobacteria bacterium]